jgi:ABC-2 type transport system ATP-binding protein
MNVIEARDLTRVFGKTLAVNAVSLDVPQGVVCGLLGANGAGKSTLLKLLVGHLRATSGTAAMFGRSVARPDPALWERIGYVSQQRYLPGWMTPAQCLRFVRALHSRWDEAKVAHLVERLEFPMDVRIRDLSRGHYVRLQIAIALGHNPELILLDEPTSGLDPVGRRDLLTLLVEEITLPGRTIVFSSHMVEDIERMADTVIIMDSGRIAACGAIDTLKISGGATVPLEQVFFEYVNRRQQ